MSGYKKCIDELAYKIGESLKKAYDLDDNGLEKALDEGRIYVIDMNCGGKIDGITVNVPFIFNKSIARNKG